MATSIRSEAQQIMNKITDKEIYEHLLKSIMNARLTVKVNYILDALYKGKFNFDSTKKNRKITKTLLSGPMYDLLFYAP